MRWLFLLLVVLNVFYAGWYQQEAPRRPVDIQALSLSRNTQQDLQLVSEAKPGARTSSGLARDCLYVGGYAQKDLLVSLEQRLAQRGVKLQTVVINGDQGAVHWLRIDPASQRLLDESALSSLSGDFNGLKHQIMPCEGIATAQ